jgi:hypothetical protein
MMGIPVRPPPTLADPRKWSKEFNSFIASTLIKDPTKRYLDDPTPVPVPIMLVV